MDILKMIGGSDFQSLIGGTAGKAVGGAAGAGEAQGAKKAGGIGGLLGDVFSLVSGGGVGGIANKLMDSLGLPDWMGDVIGCAIDAYMGNIPGAIANGADLAENILEETDSEQLMPFVKMAEGLGGVASGDLGSISDLGDVASGAEGVMGMFSGDTEAGAAAMGVLTSVVSGDQDVDLASNQNIRA